MKIQVSTDYLNSGFDKPVTLQYENRIYLPVMLTFNNDKEYGAGVIFNSPELNNTATVYLNQCIIFEGFDKMTYTKDLIFELYYNDYCMYFIPNDGEVKFEKGLPNVTFNGSTCIEYFDKNNIKNKGASSDLTNLKQYFLKYK